MAVEDGTLSFGGVFDGVVYGTGANMRVYRVDFVLGELLPNYLPPA